MAGTTIDEDNVVYKTLTTAVNHFGYDVSLNQVLEICAGMEKREAIESLLKNIGGNIEDTEAIFDNFSKNLIIAYQELDVKPIKGIVHFLIKARLANKKIVLNTGYKRKIAELLLSKLGWKKNIQFDELITADDTSESRPSPEMIQLAMSKFGITNPKEVLKAGDSTIDIEEGKNAGCGLTIGVLSGAQNQQQLETAKPDYIFNSLSDAEELFFRE